MFAANLYRGRLSTCLMLVVFHASLFADDPPLSVILEGSLPTELAPHGAGNVYAPSVLIEDGTWRMWYGGQGKDGHDRIHLATSADGKKWKRQGVVLDRGKALHVNDPSVLKHDGLYWMYYTRAAGELLDTIHLATSKDGVTWEEKGEVLGPGEKGSFDSLHVARPSVLFDEGLFKLWYDGRKDLPPGTNIKGLPTSPDSQRFVGYATSTDGIHFQRRPEPVFGENAGAIDVVKLKDKYLMLFESSGGTRVTLSDDGIDWSSSELFLRKTFTDADAYGHVTPHLVYSGPDRPTYLLIGCNRAETWDHNTIGSFPLATAILLGKVAP